MKTAGIRVAVFLSAVVAVSVAHAAPYAVDSLTDAVDADPGDGVCATAAAECTLRAAVQEANAHAGPDVITLPAGSYGLSHVGSDEDAAATGDLDVTDDLTVNGAGAGTTIIDGLDEDRVFHVVAAAFAIRDVTIRGGHRPSDVEGSTGGGMFVKASAACTVERVTFRDNSSAVGGGLTYLACGLGDCSPWALTITGSTFDANTATGDGSAALLVGQAGVGAGLGVTIADSTFTGNVSQSTDSGAVFLSGDAAFEITNTAFTNNATGSDTLTMEVPSATLSGCTFDGNGFGLDIFSLGPVSITDVTITNNNTTMTNDNGPVSFGGGSIYSTDTVTISGGEVSDNGNGGACGGLNVYAGTGVTIDGTTFRRNNGGLYGGGLRAISLSGTLSLTNVEASENSGLEGGGIAAVNSDGDVVLTKVRVLDNGSGATPGGGLYATATGGITLSDSTVSGNVSDDVGGGAHLTAGGALSIQGTTIAQNHAGGSSGGLFASGSTFAITNATISGNVAEGVAGGGGLSAEGTGTIRNVTFVDNDAPTASALLTDVGTVTMVSSIVAGTAANHCGGTAVTSGGNNLDSNGSCAFAAPGDQNGVDPQLGPLADNGGPTLTHLPAAGSPVLDHGAAAGCPATDQRGETRPKDADSDGTSVCDIGAVEAADGPDRCPNDPAKRAPGVCGCGVADDAAMANGTADCLINGELKARIARAKAVIGSLSGDQDPTEAELSEIGGSFKPYLTQFDGQIVLNGKKKKVLKLAKQASNAVAKVTKAKAGKKLDKAKKAALRALDKFDATIAPQA